MNKCEVVFKSAFEGWTYDWLTYQPEEDTPDSIQQKINNLIENYKKWLDKDLKGLDEIEKQIEKITPMLDELSKFIKTAENETNTYYVLKSYIKNYLGCFND